MALLSNLPTRLLVRIFGMLDLRGLEKTRLVSKYYFAVVESSIFSEVAYDLDIGGVDGLVNISGCPTPRRHVQTIRLHRRSGLEGFGAYEHWRGLTVYGFVAPEGMNTHVSDYVEDTHDRV